MNKEALPGGLVLIKPIGSKLEPYTTADTVAQYAKVRHKTVNELIRKHFADLEEFGTLRFEMEAVERARGVKYAKVYHLNEQQATLLITYLKNTEPVRQFKKALVRGFFEARQELSRREVQRAVKAPVRRSLTDGLDITADFKEAVEMHGGTVRPDSCFILCAEGQRIQIEEFDEDGGGPVLDVPAAKNEVRA